MRRRRWPHRRRRRRWACWGAAAALTDRRSPRVRLPARLRRLQALFAPYSGEDLRWYPVTPQMSKPAFQARRALRHAHACCGGGNTDTCARAKA